MTVAVSEVRGQALGETAELASFAARLRFEQLPADVIDKAKICFRIETKSGTVLRRETWDRPGSPANPMKEAQLQDKFVVLARSVLSDGQIESLGASIKALDTLAASALRPLLMPEEALPGNRMPIDNMSVRSPGYPCAG